MRGKWSVDFTLTLDGVDHVLKELRPEAQRRIFKLVGRGILAGPSFVPPPTLRAGALGESDRRGAVFPIERFFEKGGSTHLGGCVYVQGAAWCRLLFSGLRRWWRGVYACGEENGTPHAGLTGHVVPQNEGEGGLHGRRFQGRCAPHNGGTSCNSSFLIASLELQ